MTKILSWNINGLRSILKKPYFIDLLKENSYDIVCLQETKLSNEITDNEILNTFKYRYFNNSKIRKGYSGTAILTNIKPLNIYYDIGINDQEGRVIILEYKDFFLINVYSPNSGENLKRLEYRINIWDYNFNNYIKQLNKPLIITGDLNVAHKEIDLKNPNSNLRNAGFTIEERNSFDKILDENKLIDIFRFLNPDKIKYTYWSYKYKAREKNSGWRIDYFLTNKKILKKKINIEILDDIYGSDHAPIKLSF